MALSPFDILKVISEKAEAPPRDEVERAYVPYVINRSLSYHMDTALLANEMNRRHWLPPLAQFDFLCGTVKKGKRYAKWIKQEDEDNLELVCEYFNCSKTEGRDRLRLLNEEQVKQIIKSMNKGSTGK